MPDEVLIPYGDDASETATLLLGAADKLEYEPWVVRHQPDDGGFRVTPDVAKEAGLKPDDEESDDQEPAKAAKKTTAKKAAAKKTASK